MFERQRNVKTFQACQTNDQDETEKGILTVKHYFGYAFWEILYD